MNREAWEHGNGSPPVAAGSPRHRHRRRHHTSAPPDVLLRVVDGGLAASIFFLPMVMGGRQALGGLVLSLLALGVAGVWLLRAVRTQNVPWRWSALEGVFAAALLLLVFQIVPLPASLLAWLTPHTSQLLPLWSASAESPATLGEWAYVSLTPSETRAGLLTLLSYCLLFLVTIQRIQRLADVERLLRWCAWSAILMASFGIVQFLTSNGKFFWFYQHPFSTTDDMVKGSFTNRNHFADFLTLGLGPLIWWIQQLLRHRPQPAETRLSRRRDSSFAELLPVVSILALGTLVFACLLSLSRGGMAAMLLAAVVAGLACYYAGAIGPRFLLSLAGVGLLVAASLVIFGEDRLSARLADLESCSFDEIDHGGGRRTIWKAVTRAIPDFAVLGSGVGSLQNVYPHYLEAPAGPDYYTHAENGPLQVALETGLPGVALLALVIGACGFWCLGGLVRSTERSSAVCSGVILASLTASLAHSLVDFNWYCPACTVVVTLLAACACRLWQFTRPERAASVRLPRLSPRMATALLVPLLLVGAWVLYQRTGQVLGERYWFQIRLLDLALETPTDSEEPSEPAAAAPTAPAEPTSPTPGVPDAAVASAPLASLSPTARACVELLHPTFPGDPPVPEETPAAPIVPLRMAASDEDRQASLDSKNLSDLEELLRWQPDFAAAHLRMAAIYLRQFQRLQQSCPNAMPLSQIREAAFAGRTAPSNPLNSRSALEGWMLRAFGEHCRYLDQALEETHQALALNPLLGEGYLYLSELCFLEGGGPETKEAYLQQALVLEPHDPTILFRAGIEAWLASQFERGGEYLRASFHAGKTHQEEIIQWLAGRAPPEQRQAEIQMFLDFFQPDFEAMRLLDRRYREIAQPEELVDFRRRFAHLAEIEASKAEDRPARAGLIWLTAHILYDEIGEPQRAHVCAQKALSANPNNYALRCRLGLFYLKLREFDEAKRHFTWCQNRKPHNQNLQNRLIEIERQRYLRDNPAAAGVPTGYQR